MSTPTTWAMQREIIHSLNDAKEWTVSNLCFLSFGSQFLIEPFCVQISEIPRLTRIFQNFEYICAFGSAWPNERNRLHFYVVNYFLGCCSNYWVSKLHQMKWKNVIVNWFVAWGTWYLLKGFVTYFSMFKLQCWCDLRASAIVCKLLFGDVV